MNPATDVGKRDLPADVRSRFTEIYCDELTDLAELRAVAESYLNVARLGLRRDDEATLSLIGDAAQLHLQLTDLARTSLVDGTNHKPHYRYGDLVTFFYSRACGMWRN